MHKKELRFSCRRPIIFIASRVNDEFPMLEAVLERVELGRQLECQDAVKTKARGVGGGPAALPESVAGWVQPQQYSW